MKNKRAKLAIDPVMQWTLVRRALRYCAFVLVMTEILLPMWFAFLGWCIGDSSVSLQDLLLAGWQKTLPVLVFFILIAPVITYDILKLSLRFAGPVYRLQKAIQSLNAGEETPPIRLRNDDWLKSLIADFNVLAEKVAALRQHETTDARLESASWGASDVDRPWGSVSE